MRFELGKKAKDRLTGFEGIVTARCEFVNGCVQYELQSTELKDGVPQAGIWIDEVQLVEQVSTKEPNRPFLRTFSGGGSGGPVRTPPARNVPT